MKTINLKIIIFLAILTGLISNVSVFAAGPAASPAAVSAKNIRQKFVAAVQQTDELTNIMTSGEVEVTFTVSEEGNIEIKNIKSTSGELADFVKDKISTVPCNDFYHPFNQYYRVKIRFQED
jgi:DNA-binding protein